MHSQFSFFNRLVHHKINQPVIVMMKCHRLKELATMLLSSLRLPAREALLSVNPSHTLYIDSHQQHMNSSVSKTSMLMSMINNAFAQMCFICGHRLISASTSRKLEDLTSLALAIMKAIFKKLGKLFHSSVTLELFLNDFLECLII